MYRIPKLICLLLLCVLPAISLAANASLSGSLLDAGENAIADLPLELVPVDFRGTKMTTRSDHAGHFSFSPVLPAEYRIRIATEEGRLYGAEAVARSADGSIAWELSGPIEEGTDPIWAVPVDGTVQLLLSVARNGESTAPFVSSMAKWSSAVREGRCADAIPGLRSYLAAFDGNVQAHYLLGFCLASGGQIDEALPALEKAHELAPAMPGVALLAGQALLAAGRGEEAAKWLLREAESGSDPGLVVEALSALGFQRRDAGDTAGAIDAFERVSFLDPDRVNVIEELAVLFLANGEIDRAVEVLEEGAESGTVQINPLLNSGIERYNAEDYTAAERLFTDALRLADNDEDRANAHALLGRCQVISGDKEEGEGHLRDSLRLSPTGKFSSFCRELLAG